jgi:hypothetical protein
MSAAATGIEYDDLIGKIVEHALQRHQAEKSAAQPKKKKKKATKV